MTRWLVGNRWFAPLIALLVGTMTTAGDSVQARDVLLLQSTTSTQNSGLYEHLLPLFTEATGIDVRVVAVGTGQAIKNAENCDADLLIVHARDREEAFVAAGYGLARVDLMHNDFVIVGPVNRAGRDPATIAGLSVEDALTAIRTTGSGFVSRGDDSGTHIRELALWAAVDPTPPNPRARWYYEVGAGMGATLNIAVELGAYTLTDRSTWLAFGNKRRHRILVEGDPRLFNPYSVIVISPEHCPNARVEEATALQDWLTSSAGKAAINGFAQQGQQLFFAAEAAEATETELK